MAIPTRSEAKTFLKVDSDITTDDTLIDDLILAAVNAFEQVAKRVLSARTVTLKLDQWPADNIIYLDRGPVTGVTSVTCRTASGTQTVDSSGYIVISGQTETNPLVQIKDTTTLPTPDGYTAAITVTYTCETTSLPAMVKTALLQLISHWYENRAIQSREVGPDVAMSFHAACKLYRWGP
jgi:uncharacterized phiE125 gp8 family phage protein